MAESQPRHRCKSPTPGPEADLFGQVVRAVDVAYYVWDVAGNDVRISDAFAKLFGYAPSVMDAEFYLRALHPDDLPAYRAAIRTAFKGDAERVEATYRMRSASGAYLWTHDQAVLERDADGRVTRVIGAVSDVTRDREREATLHQALEQQTAQAEVLRVVSRSTFDLQAALEAVLAAAARLCEAESGLITVREGDVFNVTATFQWPEMDQQIRGRLFAIDRGSLTGRIAIEGGVVQIVDTTTDPDFTVTDTVSRGGIVTGLGAPLLREGRVIGTINLGRRQARPFDARQIELLGNFADQAVIAVENARLITEQREALERQTATAEILGVINASPGDLTPVFDAMLERAMRLCGAACGGLFTYDGQAFQTMVTRGVPPALAEFRAKHPPTTTPGHRVGQLLQTRRSVQTLDVTDTDAYRAGDMDDRAMGDLGGARTILNVPLLRERAVAGFISVYRTEKRAFSAKQIALLENFAAQAVIAMENARLITEQREALEQQTAVADVLRVINMSPGILEPVFDAILSKAHSLCDATLGSLQIFDGERFRAVATRGMDDAFANFLRGGYYPTDGTFLSQEKSVQIKDLVDLARQHPDDRALRGAIELGRIRSMVSVPLRKDGKYLGRIMACRRDVRLFTDKQIALLENFAAQAVIAMENARLITEQREALERQTATAEVLEVINSSPGNLQPVFQTMLDRALHLCGASFGEFLTYDGEQFHFQAGHNVPPAFTEWRRQHGAGPAGEALRNGLDILNVPDLVDTEIYRGGDPIRRGFVEHSGARSAVAVALRKEGKFLGMMGVFRQEVRPFDERQVSILRNFAAQAVIAMENARLLTEQREALEQQTATAEVLSVINANPGNLEPVFNTLLEKACELCDADSGALWSVKDGMVHAPVTRAYHPAVREYLSTPRAVDPNTGIGRLMHGEQMAHIADLATGPAYLAGDPLHRLAVDVAGMRSLVAVPLKKDGVLLGAFGLTRHRTQAFTDKHIALVRNFAAQAVIAMENARLLDELRERTEALAQRNTEFGERIEQQSATIDVLKVMSSSPGDTQPVFDLITRRASEQCETGVAVLVEFDGTLMHLRSSLWRDAAATETYARMYPRAPDRQNNIGRAILEGKMVNIRDTAADQDIAATLPSHYAASVAIPLLREGKPIGAIGLAKEETGDFTATQVELLQTFAEQAVIAISSAETYRALQDRTAALAQRNSEYSERIEQQSATIDVLQVMSSSPGDPQPVFALIVERARAFCHAEFAGMALVENDTLVACAHSSANAAGRLEYERGFPRPLNGETTVGRAVLARDIVQIADLHADPNYALKGMSAARSTLAVPMLRAGNAIGAIVLGRSVPGAFSDTQVGLLRTFAEQAVIAISSAETYRALQDRTHDLEQSLEYQTATGDVLKVISQSTFDIAPVFQSVVTTAVRLCQADSATIYRYQDGEFRWAAGSALKPEYEDLEREVRIKPGMGTLVGRVGLEGGVVQILDAWTDPLYEPKEDARVGGIHTMLGVPLLRDGKPIGVIGLGRQRIEPYTERQIDLVRTFAEQAVIAITSVATFQQLQERTEALTRSVAELQALEEVLRAVNSSLDLDTVLNTIIDRAVQLSQADEGTIYEYDEAEEIFIPKAAFGMSAARVDALRQRRVRLGETHLGRAAMQRAPVHVSDVQEDRSISGVSEILQDIHAVLAVPLLREDKVVGGLVIRRRTAGDFAPTIPTLLQTFAGQSVLAIENARLFHQLGERGEEARRAREAAEAALENLRRAQDRLVQSEKMASLGQLTAGVAHEIKNPLNFVNNFSDLSIDLLDELHEAVAPDKVDVAVALRAEIDELTDMLKGNLAKIAEHGRRADSIVKNMLLHARSGSGEQRSADVNALAEEALNLAYHGARAEIPGFNIAMKKDFDPSVGMVELLPQEITRVLVNLVNNGFYAARKRGETAPNGFEPTLRISTRNLGEQVDIRVRDNGAGIPAEVREKIFEPFFTTKPAGEGTGLGLSLSYDIIVKQHGGQLTVESEPGNFTEFKISLPRHPSAATTGAGGRA